MIRFDVKFNIGDRRFDTDVRFDTDDHFEASFEAIQEVTVHKDADPYRGTYDVTPKVDEQILPTAQKLMARDVTIKAIPIYNVSNDSGGSTVYIAREV